MAKVYQRIVVKGNAPGTKLPVPLSREARIWSSTKTISSQDFAHPIADVCFSPARPHDLAVAYGSSISLISHGGKISKTLTRFRDIAYSPRYKHDGRLLVAGTADAMVKVFDVSSRVPLRSLTGHRGPVRTSHFSSDGLHVITGSDDTTVKVWDIAEGRNISSMTDATDYVRSMSKSPASRHVWATGSFDHKARLYDLRTGKCIFTLDHGAQIDDIHVLPGGAMVLTVGGPDVRLWDLFSGGALTNTLSCHAKAVTSAAVDAANSRLFTAGLDGYVKVHDLLSLQTQGVIPVGTQALALDVAPDLSRFAVGKADGILELKASRHVSMPHGGQSSLAVDNMPPPAADIDDDEMRGWGRGFTRVGEEEDAKRAAPRPGTYRYFNRGTKASPDEHAAVVPRESTKRLGNHDKLLRKFEHVRALEHVIKNRNIGVLCGVVDELMNRGALIGTLQRFEWPALCPLLQIIKNHLFDPTYTAKLTLLLDVILDLHAGELGMCAEALRSVESLKDAVAKDIKTMDQFDEIKGGAEMLLSISNDHVR